MTTALKPWEVVKALDEWKKIRAGFWPTNQWIMKEKSGDLFDERCELYRMNYSDLYRQEWSIYEEPWLQVGDTVRHPNRDNATYIIVYVDEDVAFAKRSSHATAAGVDTRAYVKSTFIQAQKDWAWVVTRAGVKQ